VEALLAERLGPESPALAFAAAVVRQVERAAGGVGEHEEWETAERVLEILRAAPGGPADAAELTRRPALLAALFQNVDLLHAHADPRADAVGALVMSAVERIAGEEVP
jgi:hypothetical protein